eukprot:Blabericola_migrator_1__4277@NODE_2310_length_2957_cov_244_920761_g1446_i0_p1_GENE_NODE_2310_length_2957_cov_244_920761_g1446_i0NODE_2310_length_2957_cov_244_920761_g1446_i0_p1_ORF_typecomplete_len168_score33_83_NODE_2310_length_2957_cov_244_920761_g1446_i011541657
MQLFEIGTIFLITSDAAETPSTVAAVDILDGSTTMRLEIGSTEMSIETLTHDFLDASQRSDTSQSERSTLDGPDEEVTSNKITGADTGNEINGEDTIDKVSEETTVDGIFGVTTADGTFDETIIGHIAASSKLAQELITIVKEERSDSALMSLVALHVALYGVYTLI